MCWGEDCKSTSGPLTSAPYSQAAGPKPKLYPNAYTKMNTTHTASATLLLLSGYSSGNAPLI